MLSRAATASRTPTPAPARVEDPASSDMGHGARAPFALPALPYAEGALAPVISARTVHFHYLRHHAGYIATLNRLLVNHPLAAESLVTVIRESAGTATRSGVFNNAAQVWNHGFYWRSLSPQGGGRPSGNLTAAINRDFGDFATFRTRLIESAAGQFGSGWTWLCAEGDRLTIRRTGNAETPIQQPDITPLLTLDVWEHAYYLDYQNRRVDHLTQVVDRLLDWSFAEANLEAHRRRTAQPQAQTQVPAVQVQAVQAQPAPTVAVITPPVPAATLAPPPATPDTPAAAPGPVSRPAFVIAARASDSRAATISRLARGR